MSGSSLDGVDMAVIDLDEESYHIIDHLQVLIDDDLTIRLRQAHLLSISDYIILETDYTLYFIEPIKKLLKAYPQIAIVAFHGHTVIHFPNKGRSLQMLNGGLLAAKINRDVYADIRNQDIGLGGQGAPFAPLILS